MAWTAQGPAQPVRAGSYDGHQWEWRLRSDDGSERSLIFAVTGTAFCMDAAALPTEVAHARANVGSGQVGDVLSWRTPPERIEVGTFGLSRFGGSPR